MTAKELHKWRIENGYSQSNLAKSLGVITITISRWETADRKIPPFLHLALKSLPKKGDDIKRGRPVSKSSTTKKKTKKKKEV